MKLYHTGFQIIEHPDIHYGRKNADFGQGFYLSDSDAFAGRWAKSRKDQNVYVNSYELDTAGLNVKTFSREEDWFTYIFANRRGMADLYPEADVIIGPIANDTIYDTMGILTSGLLEEAQIMKLVMLGPEYSQIVIKSEKAVNQLRWLSARMLDPEETEGYQDQLKREEEAYLEEFAAVYAAMTDNSRHVE